MCCFLYDKPTHVRFKVLMVVTVKWVATLHSLQDLPVSSTNPVEVFALLGCHRALIDSYRRFRKAYPSHLQVWSSPTRNILGLLDPWRPGPIGYIETSVTNHQSRLRNIPEGRRPHSYRGGSLESRIYVVCLRHQVTWPIITAEAASYCEMSLRFCMCHVSGDGNPWISAG
jgi:hypothetical protein